MKLLALFATRRGGQAVALAIRPEPGKGDPTHNRLFKDAPSSVLNSLFLYFLNDQHLNKTLKSSDCYFIFHQDTRLKVTALSFLDLDSLASPKA